MIVIFQSKKLEKQLTSFKETQKSFGSDMAVQIHLRIKQLQAADSLEDMVKSHVGGCHPLKGNLQGVYALHLKEPHRMLVVKIVQDSKDYTVKIQKIEDDYHGR